MANTTISPNMNLIVPVVGVDPGPDWANNLNASLGAIDSHTHVPGQGIQIPPAGLDINVDLTFQGNNAINMRSVRFVPQSSTLSDPSDLGCIYEAGVDLYYNDGVGNVVRITQSGGVAGSPGSIANLNPPASASYVSANGTFVWQSDVNKPANMDFASAIFRNFVANSFGLTLSPPASMSADYTLTLPVLPGQQSFMTLDASGSMAAPWTVDNNTIKIVSSQLVVQPFSGSSREHNWELNGSYSSLTFPLLNIDAIFFAPYDITIQSIWIYSGDAGSGGTTEFDLKVASPGGSFASILSTTGKIASTAVANIWTDSGSVVTSQTGVTKPVVLTSAITAGQAIKWDLIQSMTGSPTDARIRIFYTQT